MLQSVPLRGGAQPRLLGTFKCLTAICVQVIGPNTLFLSERAESLLQTNDAGLIDALQINQASGLVTLWVQGDLWAAGSIAFTPLIYIPGVNTSSGLPGAGGSPNATLMGVL
jgi:hypothetical protein